MTDEEIVNLARRTHDAVVAGGALVIAVVLGGLALVGLAHGSAAFVLIPLAAAGVTETLWLTMTLVVVAVPRTFTVSDRGLSLNYSTRFARRPREVPWDDVVSIRRGIGSGRSGVTYRTPVVKGLRGLTFANEHVSAFDGRAPGAVWNR